VKTKEKILVLDHAPDMASSIGIILARGGYEYTITKQADRIEKDISEVHPDLLLTSLKTNGLPGMQVLELVKRKYPDLPVVIVTSCATVENAVEAIKKGASDFVAIPFHSQELLLKIQKSLSHARVLDENRYLRQELQEGRNFPHLVGESPAMKEIFRTLEKLEDTDCRVLLTGDSGTGKEVVARAIHRNSTRRDQKFCAVNCAALTESLLESELFGHEKGAFTGAIATRKGLFEETDGGILYLDEIGEMSTAFQAKLLRVVEQNEFQRVGGTKTLKSDIRILAATNRNLQKEIAEGNFREDLYYRLCVVHIHIAPLRERREDIPLFIDYFLGKLSQKMSKKVEGVSKEAMQALLANPWPGNIRELENALERGMIMASGGVIQLEDLPLSSLRRSKERDPKTLEELERLLIERTLSECNWNKSLTAKRIGIGRRTLYDKAKRLGISLDPQNVSDT